MLYAESLIYENGKIEQKHGKLFSGSLSLHNNNLVEKVEKFTGFACSIFLGNKLINTTDKSRNLNKMTSGTEAGEKITSKVFRKGESFKGITETNGKNWLIVYKPLENKLGDRIGMIAVYKDYDIYLAQERNFKLLVGIVIAGCTTIALMLIYYGQKSTFRYKLKSRELEQKESILNEKNRELEELGIIASSIEQSIAVIGKDDRISWVNESFIKSYGYTWDEIIGNRASDLLGGPETDMKEIARMDNAIFGDKKPYISTNVQYRKDGSSYWAKIYLTPVLDEQGELRKYIAISLDITYERKANEKIKQNEAIFKEINKSLDSCIYLYNVKEKKYEFISTNSLDILGMSARDFKLGKSHTELFVHPEDREMLREANNNSHESQEIDVTYRLLIDEKIKWIREKSFPILDREGNVIKVSGICSDVSNLKSKEEQLEFQAKLLSEKNKEILDSINYAKRIQSASLGLEEDRLKLFPESFVMFKPKDIVSGDFYRFDQIRTNDHHILKSIFVGDCTGHGVPGASLALLCNSILKQSLSHKNVNSPAEALSFASSQFNNLFHNKEGRKFNDGMDAGFCVIDPDSLKLYFAGAHFDCWILREGQLHQLKGNRLHVGLHLEELRFDNKEFQLQKGDMIYMSSDGYPDQFGGPKERKFMKKRLFEILSEISPLEIEQQEARLEEEFTSWIGDFEQTDDLCLIGVRV